MSVQTLDQLKAENENLDAQSETEDKATTEEIQIQETTEQEATEQEATEQEATEQEIEHYWQKSDDSELTDSEQSVPVKKHIAVRSDLKGKLKNANSEIESLKAEIEQLKQGAVQIPQNQYQQPVSKVPKLEDFDYDESKYADAMQHWMQNQVQNTYQDYAAQQTQQTQIANMQKRVDEHYQRAVSLINEHGVSEDNYRSADHNVRQTFDSVFPGQGDEIVDNLIAKLGDGSEKVMYRLGVNDSDRNKLHSLLQQDSSGISAASFLGEIKAKVNSATVKSKISKAAKPSAQLNGKARQINSENALRDKYRKEKNPQKRYQLAREGQRAGFNTNIW